MLSFLYTKKMSHTLDKLYELLTSTNKHVVIICTNNYIRRMIHKYFDIKKFYSKRSIYIDQLPEHYSTYFKCDDHKYHIKLSYCKGTMSNNMDEGCIGSCPYCEDSILYEPAIDYPMSGIYHKRDNNAIYLSANAFPPSKKTNTSPITTEHYEEFTYKTGGKLPKDITPDKFFEIISSKIPKTIFIYDTIERTSNGALGKVEIENIINKKLLNA